MADGNITVEVSTQAVTAELRRLRVENAALKLDLEYARGGLMKGRTRMREDVTRLQAEVEQLRAENAALKREAHAWWTAARDATVAERGEKAVLEGWITSALGVLRTLESEDSEDGGEELRKLLDAGKRLVCKHDAVRAFGRGDGK